MCLIDIGQLVFFISSHVNFDCVFQGLWSFIHVIKCINIKLFILLFINNLISIESVVVPPFSFLVLVICVFSHFFVDHFITHLLFLKSPLNKLTVKLFYVTGFYFYIYYFLLSILFGFDIFLPLVARLYYWLLTVRLYSHMHIKI